MPAVPGRRSGTSRSRRPPTRRDYGTRNYPAPSRATTATGRQGLQRCLGHDRDSRGDDYRAPSTASATTATAAASTSAKVSATAAAAQIASRAAGARDARRPPAPGARSRAAKRRRAARGRSGPAPRRGRVRASAAPSRAPRGGASMPSAEACARAAPSRRAARARRRDRRRRRAARATSPPAAPSRRASRSPPARTDAVHGRRASRSSLTWSAAGCARPLIATATIVSTTPITVAAVTASPGAGAIRSTINAPAIWPATIASPSRRTPSVCTAVAPTTTTNAPSRPPV